MSATASTNLSALPTLSGLSSVSETMSVVDYTHLLHVSMAIIIIIAPFLLLRVSYYTIAIFSILATNNRICFYTLFQEFFNVFKQFF